MKNFECKKDSYCEYGSSKCGRDMLQYRLFKKTAEVRQRKLNQSTKKKGTVVCGGSPSVGGGLLT